jgi:RimJ/RimL family protein N-acetyltransferase
MFRPGIACPCVVYMIRIFLEQCVVRGVLADNKIQSMIRLEKFEQSDYNRLIGWVDSESSLFQFSGPLFSFPLTREQLDAYVRPDNRLVFKVIDIDTEEVIGHAELNNIDTRSRNARICRVLVGRNELRNKGYGKAIIKELIRIGFEEMNLHRLDLAVYDFNHGAIKCYQHCGLEIEGHLRDTTRVGDVYWSSYAMSILNKMN